VGGEELGESKRDDSAGVSLQKQLIDYFDGRSAEFQVRVEAGGASAFAKRYFGSAFGSVRGKPSAMANVKKGWVFRSGAGVGNGDGEEPVSADNSLPIG